MGVILFWLWLWLTDLALLLGAELEADWNETQPRSCTRPSARSWSPARKQERFFAAVKAAMSRGGARVSSVSSTVEDRHG